MTTATPVAVSVEEFARLTGIGRSTAYRLAADGEVPTVTLGHRLVVPVAWIEAQFADAITRWESR